MAQPDICSECIENNHEECKKKKPFAKLAGIKCECFVCWNDK